MKQIEECAIKVRGELEKIMITIKKLNGLVQEVNISEFVHNNEIDVNSEEIIEFG